MSYFRKTRLNGFHANSMRLMPISSFSSRYHIYVNDGDFVIDIDQISGWFLSVYNFIGPNDGQGTELFIDGTLVGRDSTRHGGRFNDGDGTVVVGRMYTDNGKWYGSFNMDELVFFDRTLSAEEARLIYEMYD